MIGFDTIFFVVAMATAGLARTTDSGSMLKAVTEIGNGKNFCGVSAVLLRLVKADGNSCSMLEANSGYTMTKASSKRENPSGRAHPPRIAHRIMMHAEVNSRKQIFPLHCVSSAINLFAIIFNLLHNCTFLIITTITYYKNVR